MPKWYEMLVSINERNGFYTRDYELLPATDDHYQELIADRGYAFVAWLISDQAIRYY